MADYRKSHMGPVLAELQKRQSMRLPPAVTSQTDVTVTSVPKLDTRKPMMPPTRLPSRPPPEVRITATNDDARRMEALRNWARVRTKLSDLRSEEQRRAVADTVTESEVASDRIDNSPYRPSLQPAPPPPPPTKPTTAPQAELAHRLGLRPSLQSIRRSSASEWASENTTEVAVVGADRVGHRGVGYVIQKVKVKVGLNDKQQAQIQRKRLGSFKNFMGQRPEIEIDPAEHERISNSFDLQRRHQMDPAARARQQGALTRTYSYESCLELPKLGTNFRFWAPLGSEPVAAFAPHSVRLCAEVRRYDDRGPTEQFLFIGMLPDGDDGTVAPPVALHSLLHRRTISLLDQRPPSTPTMGHHSQKPPDLTDLVFVDEPPFGRGAALRWAAQHYFRPKTIPLRTLLTDEQGAGLVRDGVVLVSLLLEPLFPLCQFWASNDGRLTCRVDRVRERRQRERVGLSECYRSDYFYSKPRGYRLQLRLYLDGAGVARGSHVSAFLHFLAGEWDEQLPPLRQFPHVTRLTILDPWSGEPGAGVGQLRPLRVVTLPNTDGFMWDFVLNLASSAEIKSEAFVRDDTLLVQVQVEPAPG